MTLDFPSYTANTSYTLMTSRSIFTSPHLNFAVGRISEDIAAIERWATTNGLTFNARKTKALLLGSARFVNSIRANTTISLKLNGAPIELVDQATSLGVLLSGVLSWSEQVNATARKVNGALWRLKLHQGCLSTALRNRLVSSLIFPLFDYCFAVFTDLTGQQKLKLRRLINACVRFIYNLRKDEHVSDYYNSLGWLSADSRRTYLVECLLFSILRSGVSAYLACDFRPGARPRAASRASPHDLAIPTELPSTNPSSV
ncbi:uncharacterized protein LOC105834115 [Monomorium pharaonis]|uniref:uncharacterized protein LOC105834115 n=1 Tax=Monomorium pharaonis TaxID=307658 RepID=UPI00063EE33C|nr:uncharacterized protein LOC105834115 [Monomorium pharaonis]